MPTEAAVDNGATDSKVMPTTLPAIVTVEVNGATIVAPLTASKAGKPWYEAVQFGNLGEGSIVDAIGAATVLHDGEAMERSSQAIKDLDATGSPVHLTPPSEYRKGVNAGKPIPNSGGKPITAFVKTIANFGGTGEDWFLLVTVKGEKVDSNTPRRITVKVTCQKAIFGQGREPRVVGSTIGDLSFG